MAFFDRVRALFRRRPEPPPEPAPEPAPVIETPASRAAHALAAGDPVEAIALLRSARGTAEEPTALDAILISLPDELPTDRADDWDSLFLLLGDVLVARGDRRRACEQLKRARSTAALVLRADLLAEGLEGAPTPEELDLALALYAEALRLDIDAPGARERWARLRARLGQGEGEAQPAMGATLLASTPTLPFTLVREVARGGSGVVYEARAALVRGNERTIALKLAHARGGSRSMLTHEARVAARFRGEGVVPILDLDPEEGWLAMAWAAGGSLRGRLRAEGDALVRRPRAWLPRLLDVLADVHAVGWVHGDLKPANVLFDDEDRPWLGDFALARAIGDAATPGSAGYVSPERMAGAPYDPRDDVFAVGKILDEVLSRGVEDAALRALADACLSAERPRDARAVREALNDT